MAADEPPPCKPYRFRSMLSAWFHHHLSWPVLGSTRAWEGSIVCGSSTPLSEYVHSKWFGWCGEHYRRRPEFTLPCPTRPPRPLLRLLRPSPAAHAAQCDFRELQQQGEHLLKEEVRQFLAQQRRRLASSMRLRPRQILLRDKVTFVLGTLDLWLSAYWLGWRCVPAFGTGGKGGSSGARGRGGVLPSPCLGQHWVEGRVVLLRRGGRTAGLGWQLEC